MGHHVRRGGAGRENRETQPETGERNELSEEEYAAVFGMGMSGAMGASTYESAYYQGASDAMDATYGASGMSPEEIAYYQGMTDYMTYCM